MIHNIYYNEYIQNTNCEIDVAIHLRRNVCVICSGIWSCIECIQNFVCSRGTRGVQAKCKPCNMHATPPHSPIVLILSHSSVIAFLKFPFVAGSINTALYSEYCSVDMTLWGTTLYFVLERLC